MSPIVWSCLLIPLLCGGTSIAAQPTDHLEPSALTAPARLAILGSSEGFVIATVDRPQIASTNPSSLTAPGPAAIHLDPVRAKRSWVLERTTDADAR